MKNTTIRGDQVPPDPAERADHRAPGKVTATGGLGAPVQRSAASDGGARAAAVPRSMSEFVPTSSDVTFLDSIVGPQIAPVASLDSTRVQKKESGGAAESDVHALAAHGTSGPAGQLPFMDQIQASFGAHDVSGIKSHEDDHASEAARSMGATAFASGDSVAFGEAPDLHTAAHEAAHIVQQRSGVSLKGGVGASGDMYEQHADAVASAVVAGRSAESLLDQTPGAGAATNAVQRFGSREHKDVGDIGSGEAIYGNAGFGLTHGDLVMLRGDYFEEDELLRFWDRPSLLPGRMPGTQDEIIYAIHHATSGRDGRFGGRWSKLRFSDSVKTAVDNRYYRLAEANSNHFVDPGAPGFGNAGLPAGSAPATYRGAHERAILEAYRAGTKGESPDPALITEAMGQHFLTDAFSSGHIMTPRHRMADFWNRKFSRFGAQFVDKVVKDMSRHLADHADGFSDYLISASDFEAGVRATINAKMAGKPPPMFGDLLSVIAHDHDNEAGLRVINDVGWRWTALGDGSLYKFQDEERQHGDVIVAAVAAGCGDVREAYSLGSQQRAAPLGGHQVYEQIRNLAPSPAKPSGKYAPEQYMPRPDPQADQGEIQYKAESLEQLWNLPIRKGGTNYGSLISQSASDGQVGHELKALANGMPAKQDPFKSVGGPEGTLLRLTSPIMIGHGWVYPRRAFSETVLARLKDESECLAFMLELVGGK